ALGQLGQPALAGAGGDARVDGGLGQRGVALGRGLDALDELVGRGVLEQVAAGARVERGEDAALVGERRQDDDLRVRVGVLDALRGLHAVGAVHLQVHQHDVRAQRARGLDRLLAARDGADDVEVLDAAQQLDEPLAHDGVVVDDEDPGHAIGTSAAIVVPAPGWDCMVTEPPASSARSLSMRRPKWPCGGAARTASESKPTPSSLTVRRATVALVSTRTSTRLASACSTTLRSASCAMRYSSACAGLGRATASG